MHNLQKNIDGFFLKLIMAYTYVFKYLWLLEDAVLLILHKLNLPFIGIIVQI